MGSKNNNKQAKTASLCSRTNTHRVEIWTADIGHIMILRKSSFAVRWSSPRRKNKQISTYTRADTLRAHLPRACRPSSPLASYASSLTCRYIGEINIICIFVEILAASKCHGSAFIAFRYRGTRRAEGGGLGGRHINGGRCHWLAGYRSGTLVLEGFFLSALKCDNNLKLISFRYISICICIHFPL